MRANRTDNEEPFRCCKKEIKFEQKFDQLDFALIYTEQYMKNITKEFINVAKYNFIASTGTPFS